MKTVIQRMATTLVGACTLTLAASAQTTIEVDFDSTDMVELANGTMHQATPSGMTDGEKAQVIMKLQEKYDEAGEEKFRVVEAPDDSGGGGGGASFTVMSDTIKMVVSGSSDPKRYGNAGKPGMPGIIMRGGLMEDGFTGDDLCKATAGVTGHEAGHKLGLGHNCDSPPSCMTKGSANDPASGAGFNDDDKKKLMENCGEGDAEGKDGSSGTDAGSSSGDSSSSLLANGLGGRPNNDGHDAMVSYLVGPSGIDFGYLSSSGNFVYQGDSRNVPGNPTPMTFLYDAGVDFAVRDANGTVYSLSSGAALYNLAKPTPTDHNKFRRIEIAFFTNFGPVLLSIDNSSFPDKPGAGFFDFPGNGVHAWADMGSALAGASGEMKLIGAGTMAPGATNVLALSGGTPNASGFLVVGGTYSGQRIAGGVLIPTPDLVTPITLDANGEYSLAFASLPLPPGTRLWYQVAVPDASNPGGFALSNGLRSTSN